MRWHKIVSQTRILLILSITNVSLAAPVVVRNLCDACTNGLDIGEDASAMSWKRVNEGGDLLGLTQASQIDGSFAVSPSDSDHESMEVHGESSPKQTFTLADWQAMFTNRPWWMTKGPLRPSPVSASSTASEDSGGVESTPAVDAPPPESGHESDMARRPIEVHLSNSPGSWTTSDDESMTSDDASMEVHDATSPRQPLTQSDRWSMSTNPPSSPASSTFSDHGSTDYYTGPSQIQSASSNSFHSTPSELDPSRYNYLDPSPSPDDHRADGHRTTSSEEPETTSFFSKLVRKLKFWRRISSTARGA